MKSIEEAFNQKKIKFQKTYFSPLKQLQFQINKNDLREVVLLLDKMEPSLSFLENILIYQQQSNLIINYFFRSLSEGEQVIVKLIEPLHSQEIVEIPSVSEIKPAAASFEKRFSSLFGVRFLGVSYETCFIDYEVRGFPLRVSFEGEKRGNGNH